jgi:hypothetical protein
VSISVSDSVSQKFGNGISKWKAVVPVNDEYSAITEFTPYYQTRESDSDFDSYEMEAFAYNWMCYYSDKPFVSEQDISSLAIDERFLDMISQSVKKDVDNQFCEDELIFYAENVLGKNITANNLAYDNFYMEHLAYYSSQKGNIFQGFDREKTAFSMLKTKALDEEAMTFKLTYDVYSDFAYMNVCRTITFIFYENPDGGFRFVGTEGEYVTEYQPAIKEAPILTNRT